jgi:hypothetical protein
MGTKYNRIYEQDQLGVKYKDTQTNDGINHLSGTLDHGWLVLRFQKQTHYTLDVRINYRHLDIIV